MILNNAQIEELKKPIDPARVRILEGFSYIEIWDVRRLLNVIFGFAGWSADTSEMILISQDEVKTAKGRDAFRVVYRAKCTLRLGDAFGDGASYTEWAADGSTHPVLQDAHDLAIKNAESQALKRCAVNLGDQFGLSLYNNGSTEATVIETLTEEFPDADKVSGLLQGFNDVNDLADVDKIIDIIKTLDISEADKVSLRSACAGAKSRLSAL